MTSLYEACAGLDFSELDFSKTNNTSSISVLSALSGTLQMAEAVARSLHVPGFHANGTAAAPAPVDPLTPLAADLVARGYTQVLGRAGILSGADGALAPDHLFTNMMLANGMMADIAVFTRTLPASTNPPASTEVVVAFQLGTQICGHPGIVHGGLTTAMIDESLGYLMYLARRDNQLAFDHVLTGRLETDFRKPLMAGARVVVTTRVTSVEGRKIWATAVVSEGPVTDEQFATAVTAPVRKSASDKDVSQQGVTAASNPKPVSVAAAVAKGLFVANRPAAVPAQTSPAVALPAVAAAAEGGVRGMDDGTPSDV